MWVAARSIATSYGSCDAGGQSVNYLTAAEMYKNDSLIQIRDSIVVSISACHAEDPGSIPGRGIFFRLNIAFLAPAALCLALLANNTRGGIQR